MNERQISSEISRKRQLEGRKMVEYQNRKRAPFYLNGQPDAILEASSVLVLPITSKQIKLRAGTQANEGYRWLDKGEWKEESK